MKIGICGNIDFDQLSRQLDNLMPDDEIIVGQAGHFQTELEDPQGEFRTLDVCILVLDWQVVVPGLYRYSYGDDYAAITAQFRDQCKLIATMIDTFRTSGSRCPLLLFSPITAWHASTGFIDRLLPDSQFRLFSECQEVFNRMCRALADVFPVDMDLLASRIGLDRSFDRREQLEADQPFSLLLITAAAGHIHTMCRQIQRYPLKCIVLDLDNTLWGGVVGEDGYDAVVLSDTGPGRAFKDFQVEIVRLYNQGALLALCSKNNTCDALAVLENHPHMLIRPSMIACFRINWDDKPKNILEISQELNIGLDSMLFVDDSPVERAMITATLPQVEVLQLPRDPSFFAETVRQCSRFWPLQITPEDVAKNRFYAAQRLRSSTAALAPSIEAYLCSSDITVTIDRVDQRCLPRVVQLFNKTNQFNLTTRRYTQEVLAAMLKQPDINLFYLAMTDRFGDYGIVGVALVKDDTLDSFLLSCRAFGMRAEEAFLCTIIDFFKSRGVDRLFGIFIPSARNGMVKDFYQNNGFTLYQGSAGQTVWQLSLKEFLRQPPRWVGINNRLNRR
ncbi:MAG: HAD-IIIC family phosphatase [Chitinivibrionales bacterium]|nr:HAD-IIIC family phosphatase [Chitinivibrionales bacterium]